MTEQKYKTVEYENIEDNAICAVYVVEFDTLIVNTNWNGNDPKIYEIVD